MFTTINTINLSEFFLTLTERFTLFISFILVYYLIGNVNKVRSLFYYLILVTFLLDLSSIYYPFISDIINLGSPNYRDLDYRGYSGNINIMAFVVLFKVFIMSFFAYQSSKSKMYFIIILNTLGIYAIYVIFQTRGAILASIIALLFTLSLNVIVSLIRKKSFYQSTKRLSFILLIPIIVTLSLDFSQSSVSNYTTVQERVSGLTDIATDKSLSQRLRYYSAALKSFLNNPILGVGLGNWEIESIKYENPYMTSFVVPYHAHNDFLELLAETGFIGMSLFYGSIFLIFIFLIKKLVSDRTLVKENDIIYIIFLTSSILIYLVDSSFNFPFDRTFQQVYLIILLSFSIKSLDIKPIKSFKVNNYFILSLIFIYPISTYSSLKMFKSSQEHRILLRQFNTENYSFPDIEVVKNYETNYLNITPTALSINTIIGMYYLKNDMFKESIPYFKAGIKDNPYIYLSESMLSYAYGSINKLDSAFYFSDIAIKKVPNNPIYFGNFALASIKKKDSLNLKKAYNNLNPLYKRDFHDEIYLTAMNSILTEDDKNFVLEDFVINMASGNDKLKKAYYSLKLGTVNVEEGDELYKLGIEYFENQNFEQAALLFEQAANLNEYEFAYRENAANSYLQIGNYQKSLELANELIEKYKYNNPKTLYIRALSLFSIGRKNEACIDIKKLQETGYIGSTDLYTALCFN